jgi:hypothetical protein
MKKALLLIFIVMIAFPAVNAQPERLGGGPIFNSGYHFHDINSPGNKSGNLAISLKHTHKISVPIEFSPTFSFCFPHVYKDLDMKETVTSLMFEIDIHYIFNSLDKFEFYGLAGLNLLSAWKTTRYAGNSTATSRERDRALGLNLGAGSYLKLTDQFDLYMEAKYILSKYPQFMLSAGILINIDWLKKHEDTGIN